jgi:hypothetical protein
MSIRSIRTLSLLGSLLAFCGGISVLAWSILVPPTANDLDGKSIKSGPRNSEPRSLQRLSKDDFAAVVDRKYQAPLFDPPPAPPPAPPPPKPKPTLSVKLIATMVEPTGNQAMFSDPKGSIQIVGIGSQIASSGAPGEIMEIESNRVVVKLEEELLTLQLSATQ